MDPTHLQPDELKYELSLRKIRLEDPNHMEQLRLRLLSEPNEGREPLLDEQRLTRQTTSQELKACECNFDDIENALKKAFQNADDELMEQGQSRLIYIARRVNRLLEYSGGHGAVARLAQRIEDFSKEVITARDSFGSGEQGAVQPLDEQHDLLDLNERTATGAIPKTTRNLQFQTNARNVQPPQHSAAAEHQHQRVGRVQEKNTDEATDTRNYDLWEPNIGAGTSRNMGSSISLFNNDTYGQQGRLTRSVQDFFVDPAVIDARVNVTSKQTLPKPIQPPQSRANVSFQLDRRDEHTRPEAFGQGGHRIHQWTLRFSGGAVGLDVEDFLFRVERQATLYGVSRCALVIGIGNLLTGRALQWYWTFQREEENATWEQLKVAMTQRYAPNKETDYEIRSKIENRRQTPNESFNDFCQDVEALNVRLNHKMLVTELVDVLRRNMSMTLRKALWQQPTRTVSELLRLAGDYERLCREDERFPRQRRFTGINEITGEDQINYKHQATEYQPTEEYRGEIEAMRTTAATGADLVICWNCQDIGHVFAQCPKQQMAVFCFSCGMRGVISVNCPKCSLNPKRGQPIVSSARPAINQAQILSRLPPPNQKKTNPFNNTTSTGHRQ